MKNFIRLKLCEALRDFKTLEYDPRPELKAAGSYPSLSKPSFKLNLNKIRFKISKAIQRAESLKNQEPENNYFIDPNEGLGFYQVEFRHDGQIKTKHIMASPDMQQQNGKFRPTDVGTCRNFQNIAKYCFVKAGLNNQSSPAEDAADKALIIFKSEILDFYGESSYIDDKASLISKEKMSPKEARHKEKKDLETNLKRRISDSEWENYLRNGIIPKPKSSINMNPEDALKLQKKQEDILDRIKKAKEKKLK